MISYYKCEGGSRGAVVLARKGEEGLGDWHIILYYWRGGGRFERAVFGCLVLVIWYGLNPRECLDMGLLRIFEHLS